MEYQTTGIQRSFEQEGVDAQVELVHVNGPRIATSDPDSSVLLNFGREAGPFYEWFTYDWLGATYGGLDEAVEYLNSVIEKRGPFDVLLGFSQGATMATILTARMMKQVDHDESRFKWKALLLVSGVDPSIYHRTMEGVSNMKFPSIHVAGNKDLLYWRSQVLYGLFADEQRVWISHQQGHMFPTPFYHKVYDEIRDAILPFLK
ncbi:UNVERIFIED_CONTAM: hypothetical protein HDU68_008383 [Siphonaria sp. JEL0065]|nr:hypothetical protein HDU68_008383 [Siphonaria sp. JEL0065]